MGRYMDNTSKIVNLVVFAQRNLKSFSLHSKHNFRYFWSSSRSFFKKNRSFFKKSVSLELQKA